MAEDTRPRADPLLSVLSAEEVEGLVVKMGKEGVTPSKIGLILRDQYAVPSIKDATGKSVKHLLDAHGIKPELPENLKRAILRAVKLHGHLARNRHDFNTKRSLEITEARITKLARYYVKEGALPAGWRYDRERAALLVRA